MSIPIFQLQGCLHIFTPTDTYILSLAKQHTFLNTIWGSERQDVQVEHTLKKKNCLLLLMKYKHVLITANINSTGLYTEAIKMKL